MRFLPLVLALVLAPLAASGEPAPMRTDERLGTSILAFPATVWLDPGAALGDRNPRVILPGTSELRAGATVTDPAGNGVEGVAVAGFLERASGERLGAFAFSRLSPGVYQSQSLPYPGGVVYLRVVYDFPPTDGTADRTVVHRYAPATSP